jgi:hypothetical protein
MAAKGTSKGAPERKAARGGRRWSNRVTQTSDALDLDAGVFTKKSARAIASSLKLSADRSRRRKTDSFRSAMSMLTFYVNRAGKTLSADRKRVLQNAKEELRALYRRPASRPSPRARH